MKKVLFGIFAHPDDEAFGPSGTLCLEVEQGTDVHLILLTDGSAGKNNGYEDLGETRLSEWRKSCELIGVKTGEALHFPDGGLSNNLYLEICSRIQQVITDKLAAYKEPIKVDFMTFDSNGITGHLDHIATSSITSYCFEHFKSNKPLDAESGILRFFCLPKSLVPECNCRWVYMPCGRDESEVDEIVDISTVLEKKYQVMSAHQSQKEDLDQIFQSLDDLKAEGDPAYAQEYFFIQY